MTNAAVETAGVNRLKHLNGLTGATNHVCNSQSPDLTGNPDVYDNA